ncbi:MAG: response regulator [Verrucomicrobia bacterium]|nr:response regulator [Verrucomicrobiota bacterium]
MNNKTILLVEDNPNDVTLTLQALKKHKLANDVILARDGVEALDYLFGRGSHANRDVSATPALVLLDIKLPKVDGLEVLREIRANELTAMLPVVMLTSSREEQDLLESYRLHCNSYICKPVDFAQFVHAVEQLEIYWLVTNEPPPPAPPSKT